MEPIHARFWEHKAIWQFNAQEWEALCDRCGLCCMHRLIDDQKNLLYHTVVACHYLDIENCHCMAYARRLFVQPNCSKITPFNIRSIYWLPPTCAYRCLAEGRPLADWHPLITGSNSSVHEAGISVKHRALSARQIAMDDFVYYIIDEQAIAPSACMVS